jgi:hypothetical protein
MIEVDAQKVFDVAQEELRNMFDFGVRMGVARNTKDKSKHSIFARIRDMTEEEYQAHVGKHMRESLSRIADLVDLEIATEEATR